MAINVLITDSDEELEARIRIAYRRCIEVWNKEAWAELVRLIKQRSPQQVKKMENEKGLV